MVDAARPSNVQALRALFAQKEKTVIDGLKCQKNFSLEDVSSQDDCHTSTVTNGSMEQIASEVCGARMLSSASKASRPSPTLPKKPPVGPKPSKNKPQNTSVTNVSGFKNIVAQLEGSEGMYTSKNSLASSNSSNLSVKASSSLESVKSSEQEISLTNCDNIVPTKSNGETQLTLIKKERLFPEDVDFNEITLRKPNKAPPKPVRNSLISSNNYICKKREYRRKSLPLLEIIGQPPSKPSLPSFVTVAAPVNNAPPLPERNENNVVFDSNVAPPPLPDKILNSNRQSVPPPRPSGPRPSQKGPPNRPPPTPPINLQEPLLDEELYSDTMDPERAQSLIAEYTEEEECGTKRNSIPMRPKNPPPPVPSSCGVSPLFSGDDYSPDAQGSSSGQDDIYEEMPFDSNQGPVYSNSKDQEKQRKEDQKRTKREIKEKEKHNKMCEKLRKKYGLTGEEIPLDAGTVKVDCRGSKTDLTVHKGEMVLILRMENNPVGKWLAKNEKGKIGYVDLANIEVDADSVKFVMKVRVSQALEEDVYSEIQAEDMYESTY